jgi:hypothetical protein
MTTSVSEPTSRGDTAASGTSASPTTRQLWTRSRALLAALTVLLLFGVGYSLLRSGENRDALDPRSVSPWGSRAVSELLADHGVSTTVVTSTAGATAATGPDTTLLVAVPDLLTSHQQAALRKAAGRAGGRTVLLSPGSSSTGALAPGAETVGTTPVGTVAPGCSLAAAERAGPVRLGGVRYRTNVSGADSCYSVDTHPTMLRLPDGNGGDTVILGSPELLLNEHLDEKGNASLALQLLGAHPKLVWYLPSLTDSKAVGGERGFLDLIPDGWTWAFRQLFIAAVLAALWRARRLGPVVAEQLPVAVRAAEATEGRARLYRRANARDRAAESLRTATRDRLASLVGIPPSQAHQPQGLTPAVAARLDSPATDVRTLLYGPPPTDDAALLRLADELDELERSVLGKERYDTP